MRQDWVNGWDRAPTRATTYPSQNVICFWYTKPDTGFRTAGIFLVTQRSRGRGKSPERPPRQGKEEFVVERYGNCSHLLFAGRIEDCVSRAAFDFRPPRRKKPFNLHRFILTTKIIVIEILTAIVFFIWLFRAFLGEVRPR